MRQMFIGAVLLATIGQTVVHGITTGKVHATASGVSKTNLTSNNNNNSNNKKYAGRSKHDWNHLGLKPPTTPVSDYGKGGRARCGMPEPTKEKILHDNAVVQDYIEDRRRRRVQDEPQSLVVQTCVHVIRPEGDTDDAYLNADMIQMQLDGLNKGFSPTSGCDPALGWCNGECSLETGIRFALAVFDENDDSLLTGETVESTSEPNACLTRSFNDDWYFSEALSEMDIDMRYTLRRGGAHVLNIYFKGGESGLLGIAQFPSDWATQSNSDAVLVGDPYVIGGGDPQYGEGVRWPHACLCILLIVSFWPLTFDVPGSSVNFYSGIGYSYPRSR